MDATQQELTIRPLLKSVSRSFYLSMVFLPPAVRPCVSIAYLLARASDSVADSSSADPALRLRILGMMQELLCKAEHDESLAKELCAELDNKMSDQQSDASERELLQRYRECLHAKLSLPAEQQALIAEVLRAILDGQIWDIEYFLEHDSVTSDEQSQLYCYRVAGCVGEFWTRVGMLCLPRLSYYPNNEDLIEAGIRYGKGLQLVNILRDREEDATRGRNYLCSDRDIWMSRAQRYLADGVDYSLRLCSWRMRFTSILPAMLGLKTLQKIKNASPSTAKVKIKRSTVYWTMLQAFFLTLFCKRR